MVERRFSVRRVGQLVLVVHVAAASLTLQACEGTVFESDGGSALSALPGSDAAIDLSTRDGSAADQADSASANMTYADASGGLANDPAGSDGSTNGMSDTPVDTDPCANEDFRFADAVTLSDISLYQVVKVPLFQSGVLVSTRDVPVVQGKRALVRVHVSPHASFEARTLRAVLTLVNGGVETRLTRDLDVTGASTESNLASTFNFEVDSASIAAGTRYRAAVVETRCDVALGTAAEARAPVTGTAELGAESVRKLRVRVVPTIINGITATPTQTQLDAMRSAMLAYYPVPDVELSVRDPYDVTGAWTCASGDGWSCTLDAIVALRGRDAPPADMYYYALLTPAANFRQYCGSGCTLGVAYATPNPSTRYQVGIGVGYNNDLSYDTMVHELGHAHGRQHAPCAPGNALDPSSIDQSFPSATADTDSWGWDSRSGELMAPDHKDVMSYCDPHWIGSYNYSAIAARSVVVNKELLVTGTSARSAQQTYRNLIVSARGASYGELVEVGVPPGEPLWADVRDAAGATVDRVLVFRAALSNETSAFLFVPTLPDAARVLHIDDRDITLPR